MTEEKFNEHIKKMYTLKSLTLDEFVSELHDRIYANEEEKNEIIERQIQLEGCVFALLKHRKPSNEDYTAVTRRLQSIREHLRNPALLDAALRRDTHTKQEEQ